MTTPDLAALTISLRAFVQAEDIQPDPTYLHWNSGLYAVLDCVYSSQAKYAQTVLPLLQERFPRATDLLDIPELKFSAFVESVGASATQAQFERYAVETMRTRNKIAGRLKVEVAYDICQFFIRRGYETKADLLGLSEEALESLVLVDLVTTVRGIGPVLGRYLLLLLGLEQHVKPDTLLSRLIGRIGGWQPRVGHEEDMRLIREAVSAVAHDLGTTPARLDNALWFYESTGSSQARKPAPELNPAHPVIPRTMADLAGLEQRHTRLDDPHHSPLKRFVRDLRTHVEARGLSVPDLDPLGGGIHAQILYLLEAPGPKAARHLGGSGLISMDNDDPTAESVFQLTREAGVPRDWVVSWNIVPWYVGDGDRIQAVTPPEIDEGREHLRQLLALLPQLQVVVTLGRPAAQGWQALAPTMPHLTTLMTWHASGLALNGHPARRAHLLSTLQLAQQLVAHRFDSRKPSWVTPSVP